MKYLIISILVLLISSCKKDNVSYNYPDNQDYARNSRAGSFLDKDLVLYGAKEDKKDENIEDESSLSKSKLWKSSVDVIGSLFPIALVESNSGLISTQWYQEDGSDRRVKINALVKEGKAKEKNVRILVFRQKMIDGKWQDSEKEDSSKARGSLTAKLIRDKILGNVRR